MNVEVKTPNSVAQKRLIALLDYIEHVEKLNRKPAFTVPQDFYCGYEADLRGLPGIEFDLGDDGETWMRILRLAEVEPPSPPPALKPWLLLTKSPDKEPALRDEIVIAPNGPGGPTRRVMRSEQPELEILLSRYTNGPWAAWAEAERPRRKSTAIYNALYLLHQSLESEGAETPLEMVWGIGVAVWKHQSGTLLQHPIISQNVEVGLDTDTLALEVRPRERPPVLETDSFAELDVPGVVHVEEAWRGHVERMQDAISPFTPESFEAVLKASVGFLDATGVYQPQASRADDDRSLPAATEHLVVTDTWVLFARRRSPNFLIEDLERLRRNLDAIKEVPEGPAALVTELPDQVTSRPRVYFRGLSYWGGGIPNGSSVKELYFPKPYNDEQVSIVEKLETSSGVVVQGPPGTGKTHTIANVICHYLANGKRILVTSKGEPALAVLREQIPESVRPLSVALLTDEKDGIRQFEHAIQAIAATVTRIQPDELERDIVSLGRQIDELHAQLSSIDTDVERWAKKHLQRVRFEDREVLPIELARLVVEQEGIHNWFPDPLAADFSTPGITDADIHDLRRARRALGRDLAYGNRSAPAADSFPDAPAIAQVHGDLRHARMLEEKLARSATLRLLNHSAEVLAKAEELLKELAAALATYDRVYEPKVSYTATLHRAYIEGSSAAILELLDSIARDGVELDRVRRDFVRRPVEIPQDADVDPVFCEAVERLRQGKSATPLLSLPKGSLKARLAATRVAGTPVVDKEDWDHVLAFIHSRQQGRAFVARWNSTAAEVRLPQTDAAPAEAFRLVIGHIEHAMSVRKLAVDHRLRINSLCKQVFGAGAVDAQVTHVRATLEDLRGALHDHLARVRLERAHLVSQDCLQKLSGRSGTVVEQMRQFLEQDLGRNHIESVETAQRWAGFLAELRRLASLRPAFDTVARGSAQIERSGAPRWAHALRTEAVVGDEDPWTPPTWLESWRWRQAATFVDAIDGRKALRGLHERRKSAELDLARAYQSLVEKKTWVEVFRTSPPAVKAALQAYLNAIRRIGKGTGIRAVRFRKEARAAMLEAYRAVPCWIMPQWRVSETLPAEVGKFDLVIVDEASQSDIWALPCLLRGVKVMVVGDDKQVSPDGIGLAEERIKDLKNRFLRDQAHGDQMTPEKSLYDLAKVVFAGEMVMLREHFRCVAPIIEFSKREFYNHEIRPLRIPKGSERLDPPLVDVFVRGGARSGRSNKVNEAEAKAIVGEIKSLIRDARYARRTIGVVSLLGIEQAHRIFELIREEIPPEEIVGRKITVGDARTFQGKERDIMFLSMVATREEKTTATMQMYEQRFNVAASRARDRMYLFRSVELSDLTKTDLKARLIEHFRAPFHQDPVRVATLRDLCESDFERGVFDALTSAGYRVQPQVQIGGYRLDLVVSGHEDRRLAVECDGDKFHGPERWTHDMARQRVLERAGWTFWRCFGSSFNRNRRDVLDDLFGTLRRMGIDPIGAEDIDLSRYTEHREVSPSEASRADSETPVDTPAAGASVSSLGRVAPAAATSSAPNEAIPPSVTRRIVATPIADTPEPKQADETSTRTSPDRHPRTSGSDSAHYSDAALGELLSKYSLKCEDMRPAGGALWVYGDAAASALRQLKLWGFQYAPKRAGWWRK